MRDARVLLVDDDANELERARSALAGLPGIEVMTESRSRDAVGLLGGGQVDVLVTDIRMPVVDGLDLLRVGLAQDPDLGVIVLTGFPTVDTAVAALKEGAEDYLPKPVNPDELVTVVTRVIERRRLKAEHRLLTRRVDHDHHFGEIVGISPAMTEVLGIVARLAASDLDVLVCGETGTGKELVARSLHKRSKRSRARFVPVDCGAIPEQLVESELFGHEKGAFTGADAPSMGLMEFADGGTFFLDEINALSLATQAKLLRALQERRFRRLGGTKEEAVDLRVVAATNQDLRVLVAEGRFREDLYYRLAVGVVELPPLRARAGDVALLADHFLSALGPAPDGSARRLTPEAVRALVAHPWPGNVRQLQNTLRRMVALAAGPSYGLDDLPAEIAAAGHVGAGPGAGSFFDERTRRQDEFERDYLTRALREAQGDVAETARRAEIPRGTLYRLLKKHGLRPDTFRP